MLLLWKPHERKVAWCGENFSLRLNAVLIFCKTSTTDRSLYRTRYPEKHWFTEKNAVFWGPFFLIRHTLGITKIPKWKYSMCIRARNFDFSDLCTEKWPQIALKRGFFEHKRAHGIFFLLYLIAKNVHYSAFSDSVDTFRYKNFENWLKNDCFMVIGTLEVCIY